MADPLSAFRALSCAAFLTDDCAAQVAFLQTILTHKMSTGFTHANIAHVFAA